MNEKEQLWSSGRIYLNEIVDVFLSTDFEGGRHQRRIDKIPC